jgi:hypothetical protein
VGPVSIADQNRVAASAPARLRDLAAHPRLSERSTDLNLLADALDGKDEQSRALDAWVSVDIFGAFAPESTIGEPAEQPTQRRAFHGAPGVLVFVPILITWIGLGAATAAYRETVGTDPNAAGRPFLEQWQTGFGGHLSTALTFDRVATYTVLAILALLGLLVATAWDRHRLADEEERETAALAAELASALTAAQLAMSRRNLSSPLRFEEELSRVAGELRELYADARRAQTAAQRATTIAGQATERLLGTTVDLTSNVRALDASTRAIAERSTQIGAAIEAVATATEQVGPAVANAVGESKRAAKEGRRLVADAAEELRTDLGAVAEALLNAIDRLASTAQTNVSGYESAVDAAGQLLTELADSRTAVSAAVAALADQRGSAARLHTDMVSATEALERASAALQAAAAALAARAGVEGELRREPERAGRRR